jgi:hypothetical protein
MRSACMHFCVCIFVSVHQSLTHCKGYLSIAGEFLLAKNHKKVEVEETSTSKKSIMGPMPVGGFTPSNKGDGNKEAKIAVVGSGKKLAFNLGEDDDKGKEEDEGEVSDDSCVHDRKVERDRGWSQNATFIDDATLEILMMAVQAPENDAAEADFNARSPEKFWNKKN